MYLEERLATEFVTRGVGGVIKLVSALKVAEARLSLLSEVVYKCREGENKMNPVVLDGN